MSKGKLFSGDDLVGLGGEPLSTVPEVKGVRPIGSSVLVEIFTEQEMTSSTIVVHKVTSSAPLQGYVVAVGNSFESGAWGFGVGDRVLLSGSGVCAPNYDGSKRMRFFMEPHAIKAVILEKK